MESEKRGGIGEAMGWIVAAILLATLLAVLDLEGALLSGWLGYAAICVLGGAVLWAVWRWVGGRKIPGWMFVAVASAILLRVGASAALDYALPRYGNPSPASQAGYLYYDAWKRDTDAWDRARSDQPLTAAFTERKTSDQYGGLLFSSALVYRLLGGTVHRPLMIVTAGAFLSGVAVLLGWGFTSLTFGGKAAGIAAWIVALYPEAVFLGSTNMREPFLIAGLGFMLYGYAKSRAGDLRSSLVSIGIGSVLSLLISPPYLFVFLGVIALAWLWEGRADRARTGWALIVLGIFASFAIILTVISWFAIPLAPQSNLFKLLDWWVNAGARYELAELERVSGWIQYLFSVVPEWAQIPVATGYGLLQPLLPATIMDHTGVLIARLIMNLRAIGWFAMIPILIYAPFAALKYKGLRSLQTYLGFLFWVVAILASYRLADQWDNPRSRAVFLIPQAAIIGWAVVQARVASSKWLWRIYLVEGVFLLLFLAWYGGRYSSLPQFGLLETLVIFGAFVVVFLAYSLTRDHLHHRKSSSLPDSSGEV